MNKRTAISFKNWKDVEEHELKEARKTTPEQRLGILLKLMVLQQELPKQGPIQISEDIPELKRQK